MGRQSNVVIVGGIHRFSLHYGAALKRWLRPDLALHLSYLVVVVVFTIIIIMITDVVVVVALIRGLYVL